MIEYFAPGELLEESREYGLYPETTALLRACRASPYVEVRELRCEASGISRTEYIVVDAGDGSVDASNVWQVLSANGDHFEFSEQSTGTATTLADQQRRSANPDDRRVPGSC